MAAPTDLRGRSLLAVFAHPDDEAIACGGLLAWCAHLGADVALLCMTRGERGRGAGNVGRRRSRELRAAAEALGIHAVTLLDHEDGMLPWLPADTLRSGIGSALRARRPDVVITFDADGLYWHPDHIAVHEAATAAVLARGAAAPALYYVTMPPGSMRAVADHAVADHAAEASSRRDATVWLRSDAKTWPRSGENHPPRAGGHGDADAGPAPACADRPTPTSILGVPDPDAFGADAPPPTLVIDAGRFAARKLAALACHASQFRGSALAYVAERDAPRLLGIEHYRRSPAGAPGPTFLDALGAQPAARHAD